MYWGVMYMVEQISGQPSSIPSDTSGIAIAAKLRLGAGAASLSSPLAGVGGSLAQAYGSYLLNTSLLTICDGGAATGVVSFDDPNELYGNSITTVAITLSPGCSVSALQRMALLTCTYT